MRKKPLAEAGYWTSWPGEISLEKDGRLFKHCFDKTEKRWSRVVILVFVIFEILVIAFTLSIMLGEDFCKLIPRLTVVEAGPVRRGFASPLGLLARLPSFVTKLRS